MLASNRLNRRNFSTVEHTVKSVFDDRVVAQSYIYQLNNLYHEKKLGTRPGARKRLVKSENLAIEKLLNDFSNTKLTSEEAIHFRKLRGYHLELLNLENTIPTGTSLDEGKMVVLNAIHEKISSTLDQLANVQLSESHELTELSKKSLNINQLLSKLEMAFLIIIGILLLMLFVKREIPSMWITKENT